MIGLLVLVVVLGVIAYLVETYVPMAPPFNTLWRILLVLTVIVLLLQAVPLVGVPAPRFPRQWW